MKFLIWYCLRGSRRDNYTTKTYLNIFDVESAKAKFESDYPTRMVTLITMVAI